ncbi:MAG TPA: trigger factor [Aliidongia sp.]|nr:trigger factor [Aliidongia sp.]
MQITETSTEGLKREYKVVVAAQDIEQRMRSRLTELSKSLRLPGFRPGKVPMSVLEKRYGQSVMGEVLEETVNSSSSETLRERNLRPALQPKIAIESFEAGKDLVYAMSVEVLPDVAAPDLGAIELERLKPEIADEEVDEAIGRLAERYRKAEPVAEGEKAAEGDIVVLDFKGSIDGEEFPGGAGTDYELELGSNRFIPGFEAQLVGHAAGDKVTVKVTFPADYGAEHLSGKEAEFACEIKAVKRKLPAVIDDALADEVGMENLQALRDAIRGQIEADYGRLARQKLKRDLLDQLAEKNVFDVPVGMVDIEFDSIWKQFEDEKKRAEEAGTYEPEEGKTEDDIKTEYRDIAVRRVRLGLLLAEIGMKNNIQVTSDEVNRAIMAQARQYPGQEKAVVDYYRKNPDAARSLHAPIYEDKVVDFIVETAKVTDKPVPAKDLPSLAGLDEDDEV